MIGNDFEDAAGQMGSDNNRGIGKMSKQKKLIIGILAVVLICALGLLAPSLFSFMNPQPNSTGANEAAEIFESANVFLSIEIPASRYSPLMSNVPGMPFRAICTEADEIRFATDAGEFLSWAAPDYKVQHQTAEYTIAPGDTVYLLPEVSANPSAAPRTVTASAFADGREIGRAVIVLAYDGEYYTVQNISVSYFG